MIFDTHAHYDDSRFDEDRENLLAELPAQGVGCVVNVGADLASSRRSLALAARIPFLFAAVGVHPDETNVLEALGMPAAAVALEELLSEEKAIAVGEIGLDYHGDDPRKAPKHVQKRWFDFQLSLAAGKDLPILIHSRDAAADTLDMIRAAGGARLRLVMHCFAYEKEMAKLYLDMGHYLGVGGVVTYKNGRKQKEVVRYAPLDRILLETDAPYLPPEPLRGTRNDSRNLRRVAEEIAALKGISREEVEAVTYENACRFYRLSGPVKGE